MTTESALFEWFCGSAERAPSWGCLTHKQWRRWRGRRRCRAPPTASGSAGRSSRRQPLLPPAREPWFWIFSRVGRIGAEKLYSFKSRPDTRHLRSHLRPQSSPHRTVHRHQTCSEMEMAAHLRIHTPHQQSPRHSRTSSRLRCDTSPKAQIAATANEWCTCAMGATASQRFCCGSKASAVARELLPSWPPAT